MMCYVLVGLLYHNKQIKNISHFYKYTKLSSSKKYGKILPKTVLENFYLD